VEKDRGQTGKQVDLEERRHSRISYWVVFSFNSCNLSCIGSELLFRILFLIKLHFNYLICV